MGGCWWAQRATRTLRKCGLPYAYAACRVEETRWRPKHPQELHKPRGAERGNDAVCATVASAMDDDGPCADCFNLLQRRGPDPLKATKKDDDLWGGMERGGAWGVMHPPPPHVTMSHHSQLPAFTQPPRSPGGGAQYVSAQYHNAQALPPGEQMVCPTPHLNMTPQLAATSSLPPSGRAHDAHSWVCAARISATPHERPHAATQLRAALSSPREGRR